MPRQNNLRNTSANKGEHKLLVKSAAVVALMLPLSFASPAISIERASGAIDMQVTRKASAQEPSQAEFDAAKQEFTAQEQVYQEKIQAYNQAKADNLPLPNYQTIVSEQDAKIAELNNQITPLLNQLTAINESISQINTDNSEKLAQLLEAYNNAAQKVTESQNNLDSIKDKIASQKTSVDGVNEKAAAAVKVMQEKQAEFDTFKTAYEQKAAEYNAQKAQYEARLTNINSEINSLKIEIANLPPEVDEGYSQAREKAAAIQVQIDSLQAEYNSVSAEYNKINAVFNDLSAKYNALESSYNSSKDAVEKANAQIQVVNAEINNENDNLKDQCEKAQTAYDQAVAARESIEKEYKQQVKAAQAENQKNQTFYAELEGKVNELTNLVNEYNAKRNELATQAENAKTNIDTAYQNALDAYDSLMTLRQTAEKLGTQYNTEVEAYNTQLQNEYNTKLNEYNEAQAKFKAEVEKIEKDNKKNGVLSKPAWQGLSFGDGPMHLIADGGLSWDSTAPTIQEGNKLYLEIAPKQTSTITYTGNAVEGITFAGKQIKAIKVEYNNNNSPDFGKYNSVGPIWIGADADIRNGFNLCFKIVDPAAQQPIAPGSQFSNTNIVLKSFAQKIPSGASVASNASPLYVTMTFLDENDNPISFTKDMPAALYIPNIYSQEELNGDVLIHKTMFWNDFNEIVPINGSDMKFIKDLQAWGFYTNSKYTTVQNIWINNEYVDNTDVDNNEKWDAINNPDFYKSCILGVKNSGSSIKMGFSKYQLAEAGTQAVIEYSNARDVGFNQRFLSNIPAISLPLAPTVQEPTPPTLLQAVDLGLTAIGDAPAPEQVEVPTLVNLQLPPAVGSLDQVNPKNVSPDAHALTHTTCPAPGVALPVNNVPPHPEAMGVDAPQAPQKLPQVPPVPEKPKTYKNYGRTGEGSTPKTSDVSGALMGSVISTLGFLGIAEEKRTKKDE